MKLSDWLASAAKELDQAGIGTARLDALVLLEGATERDRAYLLAHPETPMQEDILQKLAKQIRRRAKHEPLAYIRGNTEFYGREFMVNKDVLEPRSESETMIDLLKELCKVQPCSKVAPCKVVDVGTGSGALAITAKLEIPELEVMGTDIDPGCLKVARQNTRKHGANIKFFEGNLLEPLQTLDSELYALLCNLPYVPDNYAINQAAAMEPRLAIYGGPDGLDIYRRLFGQVNRGKYRTHFVFTESLPPQHKELAQIAKKSGFKLHASDDFIQVFESMPTTSS